VAKLYNPGASNPNYGKEPKKGEGKIDALFTQGFHELKGEPVISYSIVAMDGVFLILSIGFYFFESIFYESLSYFSLAAILMSRFYFRLPFIFALIIHHYKLRLCRIQQNIIFPNREKLEFSTYKEKVLYIIN